MRCSRLLHRAHMLPQVSRRKEVNDCPAFTVTIMSREGATLTDIGLQFDLEVTTKYDWLGKGADGFPVASTEGQATEVAGMHLEIR